MLIDTIKLPDWLRRPVDKALRFWSLRLIPAVSRIVLPGCSGVPIVEILSHFSNRDLWHSARALAYSILMAMPPLLIFFFSLIPYFPIQGLQAELLEQLSIILPQGIYGPAEETIVDVMGHKHNSLLSIGFLGSLILATNGIHGLLQSFNSVSHSIEWRSTVRRYLLCLLLVLILAVLAVAILSLLIGYKLIIRILITQNFIAETKVTLFALSLGRWLLLVFLTLLVLSLVYYLAPVKKQRVSFLSVGSVISTLLIFGLSWAFQIYLTNFNNYNILYGSIGTLLIIMLWLYANCVVILAGYAINIAISDSRQDYVNPLSKRQLKQHRQRHQNDLRPHYKLSTDNPSRRQPHGTNVYYSPSGIGKCNDFQSYSKDSLG